MVPASLSLTGLCVALATGESTSAFGFGVTAVGGGGLGGALVHGVRAEREQSALLAGPQAEEPSKPEA